jgi:hypothetical protein
MKPLFAFIVLSAFPVSVWPADDVTPAATYTHAKFVDGKGSLRSLIEFPEVSGDIRIELMCYGRATALGRLQAGHCSSPDDPDLTFAMAVSRVFNSIRLVPATINGKAEEVDFQFTVVFRKETAANSIEIYLNNQKNVDRLGIDYISAQRFSPHPLPGRCDGWRQDALIIEAAIVTAEGRARETNVMSPTDDIRTSCKKGLLNQLGDARWIPALHQGQYVESVWVNPIIFSSVPYKREQ